MQPLHQIEGLEIMLSRRTLRLPAPPRPAVWPMPSFLHHPRFLRGPPVIFAAKIRANSLRACKMRVELPLRNGLANFSVSHGKQKLKLFAGPFRKRQFARAQRREIACDISVFHTDQARSGRQRGASTVLVDQAARTPSRNPAPMTAREATRYSILRHAFSESALPSRKSAERQLERGRRACAHQARGFAENALPSRSSRSSTASTEERARTLCRCARDARQGRSGGSPRQRGNGLAASSPSAKRADQCRRDPIARRCG